MAINIEYKNLYNITLIIKNDPYDDDFSSGTYKLDFENSSYNINNGYMIIETIKDDSIVGQLFELKSIKSYKIWQ